MEWSDSIRDSGFDEELLLMEVMGDPTLSALIRETLPLEALAAGQIGLVTAPNSLDRWDAPRARPPSSGWWPEAIRLADGPPLAYPADPDPYPILAFFGGIDQSSPSGARIVQLASVTFPIPTTRVPPRVQIWPSPDGQCGYQLSEQTQFQELTCVTLNCPRSCTSSAMTRDDDRSAFICRCRG
jgi:hypothetical protein